MRFPTISYVILLSSLAWITATTPAQSGDYLCYWQEADGTIRNLSSLCGSSSPAQVISSDEAFLSNLKTLASQYSASVNQVLKSQLEQNQEELIAEAKNICRILKFGGTKAEKLRRRAIAKNDPTPEGNARRNMISELAPSYYCPQFKK